MTDDIFFDPEWDAPFYKKLPKNDSGDTAGNQGGFLIPKILTGYFPRLNGVTNQKTPTISAEISIELYIDNIFLKKVMARYQAQTRGGTRSPEYRVTENVSVLQVHSKEGDYLLMQRSKYEANAYRFAIITQKTKKHAAIEKYANGKRFGYFDYYRPVSFYDIEKAEEDEVEVEKRKFSLIDPYEDRVEARSLRVARSIVFKKRVMEAYSHACAITGDSLRTPNNQFELEAAHIIPRSKNGADDVRNGILLTRRLHWAFDRGLFSFDKGKSIIVPAIVKQIPENGYLVSLEGKKISEPSDPAKRPHPDALNWHRKNILLK